METQIISRRESFGDKVASWAIIALTFLAPVFFIPSVFVPFQFTKMALLYALTIIALLGWMLGRLRDGTISYPKNWLFGTLGIGLVIFVLASIFSPVRSVSLVGQGFEVGTLSGIAILSVLIFLAWQYVSSKENTAYIYTAFVISGLIVVTYSLLRVLFGGGFLSFGLLTSATDNLVGSWNDLGVYVGALAIFSFMSIELLKTGKRIKGALIYLLAVSLFLLSIISFTIVWYAIATLALIFFVYNLSFRRISSESPIDITKKLPVTSLVVLLVAFVFILSNGNFYYTLSNDFNLKVFDRFSVGTVDARPSWYSTYSIAKSTMLKHPIFGSGPNRFANQWQIAKPDGVNNEMFWSTDFNYGIGLIPTFAVTAGLIGFLPYVAFVLLLAWVMFKTIFIRIADPFDRFVTLSAFALTAYAWFFTIVYIPSGSLIALLAVFTGLFTAKATTQGVLPASHINYGKEPKSSFVVVLIFVFLFLGSILFGYTMTRKYASTIAFNKALVSANQAGGEVQAEANILKAIRFGENDTYWRALADVYLYKLNVAVSDKNASKEKIQSDFTLYAGNAKTAAESAVNFDKTNYQNWAELGKVFESIMPIAGADAYNSALASYNQARVLNPKNPALPLMIARLNVANKDLVKAKENVMEALRLKGNYTDAIFYLAQIQVSEGDLKSAIQSVFAAAQISPNDANIFFQLGLLYYNDKNYEGAVAAMGRAVEIMPEYANAKYFLGLSLAKINKDSDAIKQFEDLAKSNPENTEINTILKNLRAGKDPLATIAPPNNKPEKLDKPPVKEE